MPPRDPWGHKLRRCIHCGQIGPRVVVLGGYAHRRCIPKPIQAIIEPEGDDGPRVRLPAYSAVDDRGGYWRRPKKSDPRPGIQSSDKSF